MSWDRVSAVPVCSPWQFSPRSSARHTNISNAQNQNRQTPLCYKRTQDYVSPSHCDSRTYLMMPLLSQPHTRFFHSTCPWPCSTLDKAKTKKCLQVTKAQKLTFWTSGSGWDPFSGLTLSHCWIQSCRHLSLNKIWNYWPLNQGAV